MSKRYSPNQHVDFGLRYQLSSVTPMCHATRSKTCLWWGCSSVSSLHSNLFITSFLELNPFSLSIFFNLFLQPWSIPANSVNNMYMWRMLIVVSMHMSISGMTTNIPMVPICGVWRGMLANCSVDTSVGDSSGGGDHSGLRNTTLQMAKDGEEEAPGMCCGAIAGKVGCESGW